MIAELILVAIFFFLLGLVAGMVIAAWSVSNMIERGELKQTDKW